MGELCQLKEVVCVEFADCVDGLGGHGNVFDVGVRVLLSVGVPSLGLRGRSRGVIVVVRWLRSPWVVGRDLRCGLGCGLGRGLPVVVRWLVAGLPGWLVASSSDPLRVLRGCLSPTVSVGGDGDKSESSGELGNHLEVLFGFDIFYFLAPFYLSK